MPNRPSRRIPDATVARLPVYLRSLEEPQAASADHVSSEQLADWAGVNAAKVRKDLSYLGSYGTRGRGYDVVYLKTQIERALGLNQPWPVVIVGVGNLGRALADFRKFAERGFPVVALVDADPAKVGTEIQGIAVHGPDDLPRLVADLEITIGIVATPPDAAQGVTDRLVKAGVRAILNFAPVVLDVPPEVSLRKVDLALELQVLSFYQQRRLGGPPDLEDPVRPIGARAPA